MSGNAFITRKMASKAFVHVREGHLTYLNNPKVACSTIKKSLWLWADKRRGRSTYSGQPHSNSNTPFLPDLDDMGRLKDDMVRSTFFTVVRNPYSRMLSAYLNKVASANRDVFTWQPIARRFGLGDRIPDFPEFVSLATSEEPALMDPHFAPQSAAILSRVVTPDFVGHMETMEELEGFLRNNGVPTETHAPHATGAASKLREFYTRREIDLVRKWYDDDFRFFGYSDDIGTLKPVRPIEIPSVNRSVLDLLLTCWTDKRVPVRKKAIEDLREKAPNLELDYISLEAGTLEMREIMLLCRKAESGKIANWRFLSAIGQELAKNDAIRLASNVFRRAEEIMYPQQALEDA